MARLVRQAVVHIGFARTGSTWLQQVVFPRMQGVASAWDVGIWRDLSWKLSTADDDAYFEETLQAFVAEFAERHPLDGLVFSQELFCGRYLDPAETIGRSAERVKRVFPEARILVVPRRQDLILRALYGLYVRTGGHRPLRSVLAGEPIEGWTWDRSYLEYDAIVERWAELYGEGNVMVIPYELSRADPQRFLRDLAAFCGATGWDDFDTLAAREVNRSFSPPAAFALRTWNRLFVRSQFNSQPRFGARSSGLRVHQVLASRVDPLLRRFDWPWPSRADREALGALASSFAESNARLQQRCMYNLADFGYPLAAEPAVAALEPVTV